MQKCNKFNAKKTEYNGVLYDSKKECSRAFELDMLQRAGKIKNLEKQKRFILQESFVDNRGNKIRPISYVCDFYYEKGGQKFVEDVKSNMTKKLEVYRIKKKMFLYKYPDHIFVEKI